MALKHSSVANLWAVGPQNDPAQDLGKHPPLRPAPENFSPLFPDLKIVPLGRRKAQDEGLLPSIAYVEFQGDRFTGLEGSFSHENREGQAPFCR